MFETLLLHCKILEILIINLFHSSQCLVFYNSGYYRILFVFGSKGPFEFASVSIIFLTVLKDSL